jgi:hypothetical protein
MYYQGDPAIWAIWAIVAESGHSENRQRLPPSRSAAGYGNKGVAAIFD